MQGQYVAIGTVARLALEFPHIALVLVGAGPREDDLRALAAARGVAERVIFAGRQEHPSDHVCASDVALVPSKAEGFGLVILEAMAVGRPVVAFNVPAANEVNSHGVTGLLATHGDVKSYSDLVAGLLRDPPVRRQLADAAGQDLVRRFSISTMLDGFERFYEMALATAPRRTWRA